jgi:hypothetical protein
MLLKILKCVGKPSTTKDYPHSSVIVPALRKTAQARSEQAKNPTDV